VPDKFSMEADKPIGFFDSGIGGLTVLSEALKQLPDESYIYYADTKNAPYGTRPREEVLRLTFDAVKYLAAEEIKALVVACNTATSIAISALRSTYSFPIIGMEPAVKPAVYNNGGNRVLVVATPLTLKETRFQNLLQLFDNNKIVDYLALPRLVEYAERMDFCSEKVIDYVKRMLSSVRIKEYGTLVLGCTHFIYYRKLFKMLLPENMQIIDGNFGTVQHMKNVLTENKLISSVGGGRVRYVESDKNLTDCQDIERFKGLLEIAAHETGDI
jgi:glutamate racemase